MKGKWNGFEYGAVLAAVLFAGGAMDAACLAAEEDTVVCEVNGEAILESDVEAMVEYYESIFQSAGYDTDAEETAEYIEEKARDACVENVIYRQQMEQDGYYDFTEEEEAAFLEEGEETYQEYLEQYTEYYQEQYEETGDEEYEDAEGCAENYLAEISCTAESLAEQKRQEEASEKLDEALMEGVSFTEEEVEDYFEELLEADQEKYEGNVSLYEQAVAYTDSDVLYVPSGYRKVWQVVLDADDEELEEKEAEIRERTAAGESFWDLAEEYSLEGTEQSESGTYVHQDSVIWEDWVIETVFGDDMQEPGDISAAVENDGCVYLFYYLEDVGSEGESAELTDENRDHFEEELREDTLEEKLTEYVQAAKEQAEITEYSQEEEA